MHAVDDLSDAIDVTRGFLTSLSLGSWLKLALIIFFVSSLGFSGPSVPMGDIGMFTEDPTGTDFDGEFQQEFEEETGEELPVEEILAALLVIGLIALGIYLVYALLAAIMEFVFIDSLRTDEIHLRRYVRNNLGHGVRLFVFRIVVMAATAAAIFGSAYLLAMSAGGFGELTDNAIIGLIALGFAVTLLYSIVMRYTSEFVAPIMLLEEQGVLRSWSRFLSTFTGNWSEYVVYLLLVWVIQLVVTFALWFVIAIVMLILAIPTFIVVFLVFALLSELGVIGGILALGFLALVVAFFLLVVSLIWAPIDSYFQYYALLLLGDTNEELDLIPEQRALVRGDGGIDDTSTEASDDDVWDDSRTGTERAGVDTIERTGTTERTEPDTTERTGMDAGESGSSAPEDPDGFVSTGDADEFEWYGSSESETEPTDEDDSEPDEREPDSDGFYEDLGETEDEDEDEDEDEGEGEDDLEDRGW